MSDIIEFVDADSVSVIEFGSVDAAGNVSFLDLGNPNLVELYDLNLVEFEVEGEVQAIEVHNGVILLPTSVDVGEGLPDFTLLFENQLV